MPAYQRILIVCQENKLEILKCYSTVLLKLTDYQLSIHILNRYSSQCDVGVDKILR